MVLIRSTSVFGLCVFASLCAAGGFARAKGAYSVGKITDAQSKFFETKVRPLLAERCFSCHGSEKQSGGLRLDSADSVRKGGSVGPAVIPGEPEKSPLI